MVVMVVPVLADTLQGANKHDDATESDIGKRRANRLSISD